LEKTIVKRIVANIDTGNVGKARRFYGKAIGLHTRMDPFWIVTFGNSPATSDGCPSEPRSGKKSQGNRVS